MTKFGIGAGINTFDDVTSPPGGKRTNMMLTKLSEPLEELTPDLQPNLIMRYYISLQLQLIYLLLGRFFHFTALDSLICIMGNRVRSTEDHTSIIHLS